MGKLLIPRLAALVVGALLVGAGAWWWVRQPAWPFRPGVVEGEVGRGGGTVALGQEVAVEVPPGAAAGPVRLRVERLRAEEAPPPPEGLVGLGAPVRVTVVAGGLSGPVRLELEYDPTQVPEGVPEEALFIARYDEASGRWVGLEGSQADPRRQRVAVEVGRFSVFRVLSFDPGRVADTVVGSFQAVFGGGVRTETPVCGRADYTLVRPVGEARQVLLACAERDGDDIVVKVANNRSYGLLVGYPGHLRVESRQVPGNQGLTDAITELGSRLDAWVVKLAQGLAGPGLPAAANSYVYLPPGGLVTLRGTPWEGTGQIEGFPSFASLSVDSVLAGVNAVRALAILHTGKDPGLLPLLGEEESDFVTTFDGMLRCLTSAAAGAAPAVPRWEDVRSCVFAALQLKLREHGLSALAAILNAPRLVADLGPRLTALVQVASDALTRTRWPALIGVTVMSPPSPNPVPGSCAIFEEKYCRQGKLVEVMDRFTGATFKEVRFLLPEGVTIFAPFAGQATKPGSPVPGVSNIKVCYPGSRVAASFNIRGDLTPLEDLPPSAIYVDSDSGPFWCGPVPGTSKVAQRGQALGRTTNTGVIFCDENSTDCYNIVVTFSYIDHIARPGGREVFVGGTDEELLHRYFPVLR
jgi:hypothetical protein